MMHCTHLHCRHFWIILKDDLALVAEDVIKTDAIDNHLENKIKRDKVDNLSLQNLSEKIFHVWRHIDTSLAIR